MTFVTDCRARRGCSCLQAVGPQDSGAVAGHDRVRTPEVCGGTGDGRYVRLLFIGGFCGAKIRKNCANIARGFQFLQISGIMTVTL